jgi:hypothetical protein
MSSSNTNVDKKEKEKEVLGGGGGGGKEIVMISPNCVAKGYRCEVGSLDDKDHSNVDLTEPMLLNDTTYYLDFFYKRGLSLLFHILPPLSFHYHSYYFYYYYFVISLNNIVIMFLV